MEFSVESMILSVETRPELWDTSSESYKDRHRKREGWTQVCCEVFEGFEKKNKAVRLNIEKLVITKWRTVRDGYVKGKKKQQEGLRSGNAAKRVHPYLYAELLHFLDKVIQIRDTDETSATLEVGQRDTTEVGNNREQQREQTPGDQQRVPRENHARKQVNQGKSKIDARFEEYVASATALMNRRATLEDDENLSFFKSLLPSLKQLNPSQIFDFRIHTMQYLQQILNSGPSTSLLTNPPSTSNPQPSYHT